MNEAGRVGGGYVEGGCGPSLTNRRVSGRPAGHGKQGTGHVPKGFFLPACYNTAEPSVSKVTCAGSASLSPAIYLFIKCVTRK
ncbi:hypothetical protein FKM82_028998 [Ascaphus truei]